MKNELGANQMQSQKLNQIPTIMESVKRDKLIKCRAPKADAQSQVDIGVTKPHIVVFSPFNLNYSSTVQSQKH